MRLSTFAGTMVVGLTPLIFAIGILVGTIYSDPRVPEKEWVLPAYFNGQGAFTLGCALWDETYVTPYGPENARTDFAALSFDSEGLLAFIDGPNGTELISGKHCGISVDWRAIPHGPQRPGE